MPQSTPERRARWNEDGDVDVHKAQDFLRANGVKLDDTWCWYTEDDRRLTDEEADAILYLIEEWDYGGYIYKRIAKPNLSTAASNPPAPSVVPGVLDDSF